MEKQGLYIQIRTQEGDGLLCNGTHIVINGIMRLYNGVLYIDPNKDIEKGKPNPIKNK